MEDTHKKVLIVIAILVIVGVGGYFLLSNQNIQETLQPKKQESGPSEQKETEADQDKEVDEQTQQLIEEAEKKAQEEGKSSERIVTRQTQEGTSTATTTAVRTAEGSSPIDTETGQVITEEGEDADESAAPGTPDAPSQSFTTDKEKLPEGTVQMDVYPDNIEPAKFTVSPNQAVSLSVTAAGDATEILRFDSDKLEGVAVGVAPGKTRSITFNAPEEPGEYTYFSEVANHRSRGAKGTMIVE